jgi:hypothetical protein
MVLTVERSWKPAAGPTPAAGQHFLRIRVLFRVVTGSQYVGVDSLTVVTSHPVGFGQPFGQGAGLNIPIPPECMSRGTVLLSAGQESEVLPACWQVPNPPDQRLRLNWLTNHGQGVDLSLK